eukprot:2448581-Pleurochrysis_carterae.AAC.1
MLARGRQLMLASAIMVAHALPHGHRVAKEQRPPSVVLSALPSEHVKDDSLPEQFDWRNVQGISYVTANVNQHIPTYCGSCWIHGTTAALNDRIKVARRGAFPDVMLSRQALMNCVPGYNASKPPPGCGGGDPYLIHSYLMHTHVADETCQPYEAKNGECTPMGVCRNCLPLSMSPPVPSVGGCWAVPNFVGFGVKEHGNVAGEKAMMKEIYARGPIVCSYAADELFMFNYSQNAAANEGVYIDRRPVKKSERRILWNLGRFSCVRNAPVASASAIPALVATQVDHDVSVAGWGVTPSGIKYWIIRNSWGSYWGEGGWFRLLRGENNKWIEEDCAWAVPVVDEQEDALDGQVVGDYVYGAVSAAAMGYSQPVSNRPVRSNWAGLALLHELGIARAEAKSGAHTLRDTAGMEQSPTSESTMLQATSNVFAMASVPQPLVILIIAINLVLVVAASVVLRYGRAHRGESAFAAEGEELVYREHSPAE